MIVADLDNSTTNPTDFLLFDEGSFFGLEKSSARRWFDRFTLRQQITTMVCVTWIPLAVLAAIQGVAVGPTQPRSFLEDAGMYARFLVALPLFLASPSKFRRTFQQIMQHFMNSGLVKETDRERFLAILTSTLKLRYSLVVDWICLALAYGYSAALVFLPALAPSRNATWRIVGPSEQPSLSLAEWYFGAVSQPVYGFIVLCFLYRVALWWRTLWLISRLDLQLRGSNPDGGGGLMFLGLSVRPYMGPAFALAAGLAGGVANMVLATGVSVISFKYVIAVTAVVITILFVGPLSFFYDQAGRARFRAWLSYDRAAQEQVRQWEEKWLEHYRQADMLVVPDFSAVIDFNSTVDKVHQMKRLPLKRDQLLGLIAAALLPFLPVLALQIPIKDLLVMFRQLM